MRLTTLKELDSSTGTVQLRDLHDNDKLILHPQPNYNDPNDPLLWPKWKKIVCFTVLCCFTFFTNYGIGGLAPAFYKLSLEFDKTQGETSALLIWPVLTLGLSNFIWVPLGNYFGKRPVFIFGTLLLCLSYLWGAVAQTFGSLLGSSILGAFAGGASEALCESIVNDIFYTHERASYIALYFLFINAGNDIGPLICGFVITGSTWRTHKWVACGACALNTIAIFLFCPETRYQRSFAHERDGLVASSASKSDSIAEDSTIGATTPDEKAEGVVAERSQSPSVDVPKKTLKQELSLWSGLSDTNPLLLFLRPFPMLALPAIFLSYLTIGVSLSWVVAINILNSFVLQAPPYNFSPAINGLINIPAMIGNVAGVVIGGWLVDRYSDWRARANGGVFQPETRLHLLIIPALIVPAGSLAFGYGVQRELSWVALFIGNGMVNFGLTAVPAMTMTYASESYLPVNADAFTLIIAMKNVITFGFLYGLNDWVEGTGYINCFGAQAGIYVAILALALPVIFFGERIRQKTAQWRIILT